jgi:hypothetical protein
MKRFLTRVGIFFLLVVVLIIAPAVYLYLQLPVNYSVNGLASTIDKNARLENTPGKRIILVGGSGVGMGFNSEMIHNGFPDYEVVNMGLFGQLGLCYMLNEVKGNLHEGDIVVVIPEYQHFFYQYYGDLGMMRTVKIYPEGVSNLTHWRQWMIIAERFGPHLSEQMFHNMENPQTITPMWNRKSVNQYGDFCGHHGEPDPIDACTLPLFRSAAVTDLEFGAIEGLNEFDAYCKAQKANAYFMYPAIPKCTYKENIAAINAIDSFVVENCSMERLNDPSAAVMSDTSFFDTVYHLTKEGAELRTSRFIAALSKRYKPSADSME